MQPTFQSGEEVLVDPKAYLTQEPAVGDVVIAQHPQKNIKIVKRVVEVLPNGRFFLQGDNPVESHDSRTFGTVPQSKILGRVTSKF